MKFFMKGLLFLSRVAFLCNLLFLICLIIRYKGDFLVVDDVKSTVGVLGWFVAPFLNAGLHIIYLARLLGKRPLPGWIAWANFAFLVLEGGILVGN